MSPRLLVLATALGAVAGLGIVVQGQPTPASQPVLGARSVPILTVDGLRFKDLNKNGRLDAYEDWRQPVDARVADLVGRMTLEEKAGLMVGPTLPMGPDGAVNEASRPMANPFGGGTWTLPGTSDAILTLHIRQFINRANASPETMVKWLNGVQEIAESSRLGTPAFFVTNPRNHLGGTPVVGIEEAGGSFSQWPGTLGLAATRDVAMIEAFARVSAEEHVAVGIRGAYHPQIDLATEPRWARISGTFGEDADLTSAIAAAMVRGYQGATLGPKSVALVFKHFPGGGAAIEGQDSHFAYGKYSVYPGGQFDYHVRPFKAAIDAGAVAIMPYYSIPRGVTPEQVGMSYNPAIVTDLLKRRLGFTGIVNSDSGITTSMVWGVEALSVEQRYRKGIEAGVDIYSNDATPHFIVDLVRKGELTETRVDESAARILRVRMALGIFENPYADAQVAQRTVRNAAFQQQGLEAQRRSIVLLHDDKRVLPMKRGAKVYAEGVDARRLAARGFTVVATPQEADLALLRATFDEPSREAPGARSAGRRGGPGSNPTGAPDAGGGAGGSSPAGRNPRGAGLGGMNTGGAPIDLALAPERLATLRAVMGARPTIVVMYFDRPYVVPELAKESAAMLAHFGVSDEALIDVLTGAHPPSGRLPFELPSSMEAVRAQKEDVPRDSKDPLYRFGHGLAYADRAPAARR